MKARSIRIIWLSGSMLVGGTSIWLSTGFTREAAEAPAAAPGITVSDGRVALAPDAPQWQALKLGVVAPSTARWTDPVPARVGIDETRASKVSAPLAGRVTAVFVELGQRVKPGDALFAVASPEIAALRADVDRAGVEVDVARVNAERVKNLVALRSLPAKDQLQADEQLKEAELAQKAAAAHLEALRVSDRADDEFTLAAPRAGVVVEKNILVGQSVSPDAGAQMVIADLSTVWVLADLFESDAAVVHEGAKAQVSCPSLPDKVVEGTIAMVSSVVDPVRHTIPVRVRVANDDGALRPNVYARVRFVSAKTPQAVEIPATALITDGTRQYVYVKDEAGRFARREVVAGSAMAGRVAILSGLTAGETIVDEGGVLLDNQVSLGA